MMTLSCGLFLKITYCKTGSAIATPVNTSEKELRKFLRKNLQIILAPVLFGCIVLQSVRKLDENKS